MQGAAIVPNHQIADAPAMGVHVRSLCRMRNQRLNQCSRGRRVHAHDATDVRSDIERSTATLADCPYHGAANRLECPAFRRREVGTAWNALAPQSSVTSHG